MKDLSKPPTLSEALAVGEREYDLRFRNNLGQTIPQFHLEDIDRLCEDEKIYETGKKIIQSGGFALPAPRFFVRFTTEYEGKLEGCALFCLSVDKKATVFTELKCMLFKRVGLRKVETIGTANVGYDVKRDKLEIVRSEKTEELTAHAIANTLVAFCAHQASTLTHGSNMAQRAFERASFANTHGNRQIPGYQLTCCKCGAVEKITTNNFNGVLPPETIAQKFRNKGWEVGARSSGDVCPACVKERSQRRTLAPTNPLPEQTSNIVSINPNMKTFEDTNSTFIAVEPPREISREDRRIIFARLNEVYVDEKTGYDTGWSDARVAKDLGVPLDWVRQIREENFGVENSNPEVETLLKQARALLDDAKQSLADHEAAITAAVKSGDDKRKKLAVDVARLEVRINEIVKLLGR